MKREVEILVEVLSDHKQAQEALKKYDHKGMVRAIDTYYYDPTRPALQPGPDGRLGACFRTRDKAGVFSVAYKIDKFDDKGTWLFSEEYETDIEDLKAFRQIIEHLGLIELVTIDNNKHIYETSDYEIVLEEVADLGLFLEVESRVSVDEERVAEVKQRIRNFMQDDLGIEISEELNVGKPELMLRRRNS